MNNLLNVLGTLPTATDNNAATAGEQTSVEGGVFAQLLELFAPAPALPAPVAVTTAGADPTIVEAPLMAPALPVEQGKPPEKTRPQSPPDTLAFDANLVEDLLGHMLAACAMAAPAHAPETAETGQDVPDSGRFAGAAPLQAVITQQPLPPSNADIETTGTIVNESDNTTPVAVRTTPAAMHAVSAATHRLVDHRPRESSAPTAPIALDQPVPHAAIERGIPAPSAAQTQLPSPPAESRAAPASADAALATLANLQSESPPDALPTDAGVRTTADMPQRPVPANGSHPASVAHPSANPSPPATSAGRAAPLNIAAYENAAIANTVSAEAVAAVPGARLRTFTFTDTRDHIDDFTAVAAGASLATPAGSDPLPQIAVAPHVESPEWRQAFTGGVKMLVIDGTSAASLQLNPAELGPIDVRIVITDQRADISFVAANADANAAIESALPELREQLARSGIQLGQTAVGANPQQYRQPAQSPRHDTATRGAATAAGNTPPAHARSSHRIDTFA